MGGPLLQAESISRTFSGVIALEDVGLTIEEGRIYGLVGENGSGKSTLIKILAGVLGPDSGTIVLDGQKRERLRPLDAIRAGIQVIYQDFSLFPNLSVAENLALNALVARRSRLVTPREIRRLSREAVDRIGIPLDLDARVEHLSVAERQLVAISRALLQDARLIILDEPTTALTGNETSHLFDLVRRLCEERSVSFLFVSHKLDEVLALCDPVLVLRSGRLVAETPREKLDHDTLVEHMTGSAVTSRAGAARSAHLEDEPLIQVDRLGRGDAFSDVSFSLRRGEIVGIAGLLGSGRTELAEALFGVAPAERGTIWYRGRRVRITGTQDALRLGIAYVPEDRLSQGLFLERSVADNVLVRTIETFRTATGWISRSRSRQAVMQWMDRVDLRPADPDYPVEWLSGGNQQRVVLAKWLAAEPELLILNGPTVGVDVRSKAALHLRLLDLAKTGITLLVISDDLPELLRICGRILVMKKGTISARFDRSDLDEEQLAGELAETAHGPNTH